MSRPLIDIFPSWRRHLKAANRAEGTVRSYELAVGQLDDWLSENDPITRAEEVTTDHIRGYLGDFSDDHASATVRQRYASLKQFFDWLHAEGEIETNPIERVAAPKVIEQPVQVLAIGQLERLMAVTEGNEFVTRRDRAIILSLLDTGVRLGELAGLKVSDVDLDLGVFVVLGKGGKYRTVPYGRKAEEALDRYKRARLRHPDHTLDAFWLGRKGPLTDSGINQIVRRRGEDAGIESLHAHRFRHTFAHQWLLDGGSEQDLQRIAGWESPQMLKRYGASGASERAREAHRLHSLGDKL